ncbi:hypothetical protein Tco_0971284 [Tanacetum coccineum]
MSKGVPRYLSIVVPLKKIGDEVVHKELGSVPRCQDTILGDVDAQTRFETTSKQSNDPPLSRGYTLRSGEDKIEVSAGNLELNAVSLRPNLVLPVQVNAAEGDSINTLIQDALIDKKKVIITESSIRSDLHLEDAGGTDCLPTTTIFEELEEGEDSGIPTDSQQTPITTQPSSSRSQKIQSMRKQRKDTAVTQEETQQDDSVPTPSNDPPLSGEDSMQLSELMILCTNLQKQVLDLEKAKDAQAKEIADLKKRVQKLERRKMSRPTSLKRLSKVSMSRRVESSEDQESLGALEDASKQGMSIEDIEANVDVSLVDETQERQNDDLMFDSRVLEDDVMHVEAKVDGKE